MEPDIFFSTDMVDEKNRDEFWRDTSILIYNVSPRETGLAGSGESHLLGPMMIGTVGFNSQNFARTRPIITHSGLDFLTIGLALSGTSQGDYNGTDVSVEPGDIIIHDLSQPSTGQVEAGARLCIAIDRAQIQRLVPNRNIHGMVLSHRRPITHILANYMIGISNVQADIDENYIPAAQEAFLTLLASAINGEENSDIINDAAVNLPLKLRIIDYIHANIEDSQLDAKAIMNHFGISRSNLYRLFEQEDGVAKFIRDHRLDLAFQFLTDKRTADQPNKVALYRYGFSDNSRFAYHFKNRFGLLPKDVRTLDVPFPTNQRGMARLHSYLHNLVSAIESENEVDAHEPSHSD